MRITSAIQNKNGVLVVVTGCTGRVYEFLAGVDENGEEVFQLRETTPEVTFDTFMAYDGNGNPVVTHTDKPDTKVYCVEWLNVPFDEVAEAHNSGKWEVQYRREGEEIWRKYPGGGPRYTDSQFRARPKCNWTDAQ